MSKHDLTELDKGAIAAMQLLLRGMEVTEDETEWQEMAESLIEGVRKDGLPMVIGREVSFERGLRVESRSWGDSFPYGPFPAALAKLADLGGSDAQH